MRTALLSSPGRSFGEVSGHMEALLRRSRGWTCRSRIRSGQEVIQNDREPLIRNIRFCGQFAAGAGISRIVRAGSPVNPSNPARKACAAGFQQFVKPK
jgi:hypothetical protein